MAENTQVKVRHWRYEKGWKEIPVVFRKPGDPSREFHPELVGWHCWVYSDDANFEDWMHDNMTGPYDCDFRFNGGDPMYTVFIKNDEDATIFKLRWLT